MDNADRAQIQIEREIEALASAARLACADTGVVSGRCSSCRGEIRQARMELGMSVCIDCARDQEGWRGRMR